MKKILLVIPLILICVFAQGQTAARIRQHAAQHSPNSVMRLADSCPATPKDEDFEGFTDDTYPPSQTIDCLTFATDGDGQVGIDEKMKAALPTPAFSGNVILFLNNSTTLATTARIFSTQNTINFKLAALTAEFYGHENGSSSERYSIVGYDNGLEVVRVDSFNVTQSGIYGHGNGKITFTHENFFQDHSNSGRLEFASGWQNIDEFRFIVTDSEPYRFLFVGMDNIDFEPAVTASCPSYTLATANTTVNGTQANSTTYAADCSSLVATVESIGASAVNGALTAEVWIEPIQPDLYVRRHFELTPEFNAASATGRVTLYFTQEDFDSYNSVNVIPLPKSGADPERYIANLRVYKLGGTSTDGSGHPGTYPGTTEVIDPVDADIIWNEEANRWEVSFEVAGFSGFFVASDVPPLPVQLSFFSVQKENNQALLTWQTTSETRSERFEVQHSPDSKTWNDVASVDALGVSSALQTYTYVHQSPEPGDNYYRLKMIDTDGTFAYSKIGRVKLDGLAAIVVYPNPTAEYIQFQTDWSKVRSVQIVNAQGKTVYFSDKNPDQNLSANAFPAGLYMVKIGLTDGSGITRKVMIGR